PWDVGIEGLRQLAEEAGISGFSSETAGMRRARSAAGQGIALRVVKSPDDDEIRELISQCSVIVSASDYEGFGIATIEGMSAGLFPCLPALAPSKGRVAQSRIGLNGDFEQPEAAAAAFLRQWPEIVAHHAATRAGAIAAASRYGWDSVAQRYQALYDDV